MSLQLANKGRIVGVSFHNAAQASLAEAIEF
jgi:hypothetical protein